MPGPFQTKVHEHQVFKTKGKGKRARVTMETFVHVHPWGERVHTHSLYDECKLEECTATFVGGNPQWETHGEHPRHSELPPAAADRDHMAEFDGTQIGADGKRHPIEEATAEAPEKETEEPDGGSKDKSSKEGEGEDK